MEIKLFGKRALAAILAAVVGFPLAAQQSIGEYRVGPKDLLKIRVFEIPELNLDDDPRPPSAENLAGEVSRNEQLSSSAARAADVCGEDDEGGAK